MHRKRPDPQAAFCKAEGAFDFCFTQSAAISGTSDFRRVLLTKLGVQERQVAEGVQVGGHNGSLQAAAIFGRSKS